MIDRILLIKTDLKLIKIDRIVMLKKVGSFHFLLIIIISKIRVIRDTYSSSSKLIASRVVASTSYSSLLPTIMLSNSF
jgi:hypothetical protein